MKPRLDSATYRRLGALIRLLASPIDGEILAARNGMMRLLEASGSSFNDLGDYVVSRGRLEAIDAGHAAEQSDDDCREVIDILLAEHADLLDGWQLAFLDGISAQTFPFTPRQKAKLFELYRRVAISARKRA
jgi:hypothetical protein